MKFFDIFYCLLAAMLVVILFVVLLRHRELSARAAYLEGRFGLTHADARAFASYGPVDIDGAVR